jgi:hypothetical protein
MVNHFLQKGHLILAAQNQRDQNARKPAAIIIRVTSKMALCPLCSAVNVGSSSNPYGDGTHPGAPKCAVIEMWGYHMGATIADAAYGTNASPAVIQYGSGQARWRYNEDISGKSSYWAALEDYDPNWTPDPSRWMPIGVLHDLMDDRVEAGFPVIDNVSGYSQQKFFNALQSDVISIPLYKARLLQQNNNNQQSDVNTLFESYGY